MPTTEFLALKKRLEKLALSLPDASIARAALTPEQEEGISFFSIAAHATCEHFMEQRCLAAANKCYDDYNNSGFLGRVAKHLCVMPFISVPKNIAEIRKMSQVIGVSGFGISIEKGLENSSAREISQLIQLGYKKYEQAVRNNHGMGAKYQFSLISIIGLDVSRFDPTFTTRVSQLASLRGEAAHKPVVAAQVIPEPSDLAKWTTDLVAGYKQLDSDLTRLCRLKR